MAGLRLTLAGGEKTYTWLNFEVNNLWVRSELVRIRIRSNQEHSEIFRHFVVGE
jgi:hypothetical protein